MTLFVLAYLAGVLTILSPCILPVVPFIFARADRPFLRSGLPLLLGMAVTFAAVASLAAVAGGWAVAANQYGRIAAMILLTVFGLALIFPQLSDWLTRPLVALGARLSYSAEQRAASGDNSILPSLLLGIATGLLWAPCAGPVLGLVLTGAALHGANMQTTFLLLAFAAGAATSLALALLVGGRVFQAMKQSLGAGEWVRRGLGVAVLGIGRSHRARPRYRAGHAPLDRQHRGARAEPDRQASSRGETGLDCHDRRPGLDDAGQAG